MKNLTMSFMIAAAALVAAGTASAQSMEAKIPFAFRASGKVLPAGTYEVELKSMPSGARTLIISTPGRKNEVLSVAYPNGQAKAQWQSSSNAVLSFQCGVSRCALTDVWMGSDSLVYQVPKPSLGKDEPVHTAEIVMHPSKAD